MYWQGTFALFFFFFLRCAKEKLGIFLSLSLLCVCTYPPASPGFVLFNGCLFSHLYRYTLVCVYYYSYIGLFSLCPVHIRAYESYERDRQFRITRQTKGFYSLSYLALSLLRLSSPDRMTLSLIPLRLHRCIRYVCIYIYTIFSNISFYYYSLFILSYYLNWVVLYNSPTRGSRNLPPSTSLVQCFYCDR